MRLAALLLVALAGTALAEEGRIAVSGTGVVEVVPDEAHLTIGIVADATSAAAALAETNGPAAAVIEMLKAEGVPAPDIRTAALDVQPQYARQSGDAPRLTGYRAVHQIAARLPEIGLLGTVLDKATAAGASSVSGIRFDFSGREAARDRAMVLAVADARRQAVLLADAAAVTLGPILSISEGGSAVPIAESFSLQTARASVPVEAGSLSVRASVTMVWQIAE